MYCILVPVLISRTCRTCSYFWMDLKNRHTRRREKNRQTSNDCSVPDSWRLCFFCSMKRH